MRRFGGKEDACQGGEKTMDFLLRLSYLQKVKMVVIPEAAGLSVHALSTPVLQLALVWRLKAP